MHINRNSKGDSLQRCGGPGTTKLHGAVKRALLSRWYHPKAKIQTKDGWTYLTFLEAIRRGLI
jgi:hypothetical protein